LPRAAFALAGRVSGKLDGLNLWNDEMAPFEKRLVTSIVNAQLRGSNAFRPRYASEAARRWRGRAAFRVVEPVRGEAHSHKIVLITADQGVADRLEERLRKAGIACGRGYGNLAGSAAPPAASSLFGRVVELPIEDSEAKMGAVFAAVEGFPE
jgi:hypothetical protein